NKEIAETEKELLNRGYCPLGRESSIQKLEWEDGWPYIVSKDRQSPSLLVQAPNMPEHPFEPNYKTLDHFDDTELNIHFQTLRIPFTDEIGSLTARPDFLRLYGKESYLSKHTQSLVARRWESLNFEAATSIDFRPKNIQQGAGLINYYNTTNFSALIVTYNPEKGRVLDLLIAENAKYTQPLQGKEIPLQDDIEHVHLKVVVTEEKYSYYYSLDEEEWNYVYDLDTYKLSDDYVAGGGFFTGAFVGMHCQDTTNRNLHADFDYFKYEEKRYE
ncbi:MAG: glycoside hydrolase 43 family protein, partial [Defluviitaleaceae bacterium]|nr:glycoside hydrolase 43 family protein [Defluviitaleaceae bacterium]